MTIPRLLRPLLRRRRELLNELGRAAAQAEFVRRGLGDEARPGLVVSIATAGDLVQWHPHVHLLTTDAGRTAEGSCEPLPEWNATLLMRPTTRACPRVLSVSWTRNATRKKGK